jgi:hypothetical protein
MIRMWLLCQRVIAGQSVFCKARGTGWEEGVEVGLGVAGRGQEGLGVGSRGGVLEWRGAGRTDWEQGVGVGLVAFKEGGESSNFVSLFWC